MNLIKQLSILSFLLISVSMCKAQVEQLQGPRIGATFLTDGTSSERIESNFITQFGYQWESRFTNDSLKFAFLGEWLVSVGGLEKGLFLPSFSALMGFRGEEGYEFALGGNLSLTGFAPILAIGKNFKIGSVNMPVNIGFVPSVDRKDPALGDAGPSGSRITFTIGFNSKYF